MAHAASLREKVVNECMLGELSHQKISDKYNVPRATISLWVKNHKLKASEYTKQRSKIYRSAVKVADSKTKRVRRDFTGMTKDQIRELRNQSANDYYHKHVKKNRQRSLSDLDIALVEHLTFVKQHLIEHIRRLDFEITTIMNRSV